MSNEMLTISYIVAFVAAAIRMSVPLTYAALGEIVSERSGMLNIGLEGFLLSGSFFGYLAAYYSGSLLWGFAGGVAASVFLSLIYSYLTITLCRDQSVVGIALNMFTLGVVTFVFSLSKSSGGTETVHTLENLAVPGLSRIPVIGELLFNNDLIVYLMFILVILVGFYLKHTFWGMELNAIGENPQAADTVGINVIAKKYAAEIFCGVMCGIGGAYLTLVQVGRYTDNITSGRGYIALAIVVFGRRNSFGALMAALFFGAANALQYRMQNMGLQLPTQLFSGLPYLLTVIALLVASRKSSEPAALAKPYVRGMR